MLVLVPDGNEPDPRRDQIVEFHKRVMALRDATARAAESANAARDAQQRAAKDAEAANAAREHAESFFELDDLIEADDADDVDRKDFRLSEIGEYCARGIGIQLDLDIGSSISNLNKAGEHLSAHSLPCAVGELDDHLGDLDCLLRPDLREDLGFLLDELDCPDELPRLRGMATTELKQFFRDAKATRRATCENKESLNEADE